jgi:2'-5' RNA ligase
VLQPDQVGQSEAPVAKEGEGAPAAGITSGTGLYSYDLAGKDDDEDEDGYPETAALTEPHPESIAKELAAFRRFARARRKQGAWRDFGFEHVAAGEAARLNAEGFIATRKAASGYELSPRSGMISLDLPPGTVRPVPGGVGDHHVTVVYLGPDVDDEAFAAACDRARQAAALADGPLSGTVSGVGAFPPSPSSDGKVPAWAAVAIPGAEVLREALADLSASEHANWTPHVTLAYIDAGDPLPAPLEPVPVTFTHLSAHRGDDVERFPLGGGNLPADPSQGDEATCPCGTPVVYDEMNGWQHADGSISHDDGESVSDKMAAVAKAAMPAPKVPALTGATGRVGSSI